MVYINMEILKDVRADRERRGEVTNILEHSEEIMKPFGRSAWRIQTRRFGSLWKK